MLPLCPQDMTAGRLRHPANNKVGLLDAANKFDSSKNILFKTFAEYLPQKINEPEFGFDWAIEANETINTFLLSSINLLVNVSVVSPSCFSIDKAFIICGINSFNAEGFSSE